MLHQQFFEPYSNLILQTTLTVSLTLFLVFLKIPIFFLQGLFTYIHPDNLPQQNGVKAAIRRPSSSDSNSTLDSSQNLSSKSNSDFKRRNNKSKEKFEFDENNAQIFRLKLDEAHLQSRIYFNDYWYSFIYSLVALSSFLLYKYLGGVLEKDGILTDGSLIPLILGFVGIYKLFMSLARLSFEKSASKRSDKQLSVLFGVLGFLFGFLICSGAGHSVLDFDFSSFDGKGRLFVAVLMGLLSGFLYMPAGKNARAFWIGTDQLQSNLSMIYCGWFARMILYANFLLVFFTALLWISPLTDILISKSVDMKTSSGSIRNAEKLVGNVGFTVSDFTRFRLWCLLLSGLVQIMALRPNLQMYLNEALFSWYQRLHASKVPDLDFSRAKVFLHNHYLCLVVVQFIAPPFLVLLFLGLCQIDGTSFKNFELLCSVLPCTAFMKEMTLLMAWWVIFLWTVFTSASLLLYRRGILYVS
ncbi:transmembrane protein 161B [Ricinus communis]|uniref:transmembrane protein 161B n=1 Tax=Ricinus communis TaxID=3988 RepID=UPI00201B087A|nr:transmembrane protein 161B [Ricinus communis]